jgi:hypothetical protein
VKTLLKYWPANLRRDLSESVGLNIDLLAFDAPWYFICVGLSMDPLAFEGTWYFIRVGLNIDLLVFEAAWLPDEVKIPRDVTPEGNAV